MNEKNYFFPNLSSHNLVTKLERYFTFFIPSSHGMEHEPKPSENSLNVEYNNNELMTRCVGKFKGQF